MIFLLIKRLRGAGSLRLLAAVILIVLNVWASGAAAAEAAELARLGEREDAAMLRWLAGDEELPARIPGNAEERWARPMDAGLLLAPLESVPGRPFYPVDPAPRSHAWYKYPIYLGLGLPRDLIDAGFGVAGQIPLVNIPVVGLAYEVIPTQLLIRDRRDWHRWGGRRNAKGHGWIRSKSWGWFPTANSMEFTYASGWKLRRNEKRNERLGEELAGLNIEIANHNRVVEARQAEVMRAARHELSRANGREAVSWILPYHLAYPDDAEAHGVLLTALALAAGQGSVDWAEGYLWSDLSRATPEVLGAAEVELARLIEDFPLAWMPTEALCYAQTRLGKMDDALRLAKRAFEMDEGAGEGFEDPERARLLVEAALLARDAGEAYKGLEALEKAGPVRSALPLDAGDYSRGDARRAKELDGIRLRIVRAVGPEMDRSTLVAGVEADRLRKTLVDLRLERDDMRLTFVRTSGPMKRMDKHIADIEAMLARADDESRGEVEGQEYAFPDHVQKDATVAHLQEMLMDLKLEEVDAGLRYRYESAPMADIRRRMKNVERLLALEIDTIISSSIAP